MSEKTIEEQKKEIEYQAKLKIEQIQKEEMLARPIVLSGVINEIISKKALIYGFSKSEIVETVLHSALKTKESLGFN